MKRNIIAGNWKMHKTLQEGIDLTAEIMTLLASKPTDIEVIVSSPYIHLTELCKLTKDTKLHVAAQNCADKVQGAFTGEISAAMIRSTGASHVILGHSERRTYYGETNEMLSKKVKIALSNDLSPIFCMGEVLEEREKNIHFNVAKVQLEKGVFHLSEDDFSNVIIAYEPVWAIGTGVTASPEQAQEMHAYIRRLIADNYGNNLAENTSILYGGSCKPSNAKELFANPDVDGGLIGGASLNAKDFMKIIHSF